MQRREFLKITSQAALASALLVQTRRDVHAQENSSAQEIPPDNMQLFLLMGQSNMSGRGKIEPQDQVTNPRIWMLTQNLKWTLAKDPLHFDKPIARVGLSSEFARTLVAHDPKITIGLIPCAVGGTSLDEWNPNGALFSNAVTRAREAMKHGTLAGVLWHQGEADSKAQQVATYAARFAAMIAQLRLQLNAEQVPVVMGELVRTRPASATFNAALPAISAKVPHCTWVSSEDLIDGGDRLHFDSASLRTFGKRYAAAFLKLQEAEKEK